jgi:plasmid replication initiation protein
MQFNKTIIRKDNKLVNAKYDISLIEMRLILFAMSKIKFQQNIPDKICINVEEFFNTFPCSNSKSLYNQLKQAVELLYERSLIIEDEEKLITLRWISSTTKYKNNHGQIMFSFSDEIKPFLENLKTNFTMYEIGNISKITKLFSIRLYEKCCQFRNTGFFVIDLLDLKRYLGIEGKYPHYKDFKKYILDPAEIEINKKTNLLIKIYPVKLKNKVIKLRIILSEKENVIMFESLKDVSTEIL